MDDTITTYGDLAKFLEQHPEFLEQPIQVIRASPIEADVLPCLPAITVGTVKDLEFYRVRSSIDNKYRGNDLVIFVDSNPFGEHGEVAHELVREKAESLSPLQAPPIPRMNFTPIYGSGGKTSIDEQTCPDGIVDSPKNEKKLIQKRTKS